MKSWPYLIVFVLLAAMVLVSTRNRRRMAAAESKRIESIAVGDEVMTTSGLYGTVVARHDDSTVLLSVAPGVELKWALAALRPVEELPDRYRPGGDGGIYDSPDGPGSDGAPGGDQGPRTID